MFTALLVGAVLASALASAQLTVDVSNGVDQVGGGDEPRYTVRIVNHGDDVVPATVRLMVAGGGLVDRPVRLAPGAVTEISVVASAAAPEGAAAVAATACVLEAAGTRPVACATDVDTVSRAGPGLLLWAAAGVFALAGAQRLARKGRPVITSSR